MIAETVAGTHLDRSVGGGGTFAIWQWTHSIGSDAVKGRVPVIIWYSVIPNEYRSLRESMDRLIRPVCSGAI
jgi:hypothetical protein